MNKKLYKLMNWPEIEGVIYADEAHPDNILGPQLIKGNQTLIQAFLPGAEAVRVLVGKEKKEFPMECMDEDGYYAVLIPGKVKSDYKFCMDMVVDGEKEMKIFADPYAFDVALTEKEVQKWNAGTHYQTYEFMGAHETEMEGVKGVMFRVWAPEAVRVSVVGKFNGYDGRVNPMILDESTGIFSLFIPGLAAGEAYQYEIRKKGGMIILKADPYATKLVNDGERYQVSVVGGASAYNWKAKELPAFAKDAEPLLVYEMDLQELLTEVRKSGNADEVFAKMAGWVKAMGYTHVSVGNVLAENTAQTAVHEPIAFYALKDDFTSEAQLKKLVDVFHEAGIYVIMDFAAACFCHAPELLECFDGSCLYEHLDERQRYNHGFNVSLFHYGRPQVTDFLISAVVRLVAEFKADAIRFCDTSFMLYLDYGKNEGEWLPNMYGGNENLEGIEFIKHCTSILKKKFPQLMLITDEFSGWRNLTNPLDQDGFGFDWKWNYAYTNELLRYLAVDPVSRSNYHSDLTMSYLYMYLEQFMLAVSKDYMEKSECSLKQMYGAEDEALMLAQKKLLYAYSMVHPGSKYFMKLFDASLDEFVKDCNALYLKRPALCFGTDADNFEWINNISANECVLVFERKCKDETLLIAVNFANCAWENHKIGVPFDGKYREIFTTDDKKYMGGGQCNSRVLKCKKDECDMREHSIRITMAPLSVAVFEYVPYTEKELEQMRQKELERIKKQEEARKKKELLKKEKEKIKASLKEELAKKIAKAEEEIAKGSEYKSANKTAGKAASKATDKKGKAKK